MNIVDSSYGQWLTTSQIEQELSLNFDMFKDGWPICAIMAQFMAKSKQKAKKQLKLLSESKENVGDTVTAFIFSIYLPANSSIN